MLNFFAMLSLQHLATDFELQNAIHLAELSDIVYHDGSYIRSKIEHLYSNFTFIDIHPMSGFDTELFVAGNDKTIVVAFRGTEADSLEDWVNNLDNRPFTYSSGNVHRGFWEALDQVWNLTLETIQSFRNNNQTIWLTGHSQGGALAMLAGRRLLDIGISVQSIYTYGQPKSGDMLFVSNYDSFLKNKTFRIYNEGDSVIESPPKLYHAGIGVKLKQEGGFEIQYNATIFEQSGGDFLSLLDSIFDYATDGLQVHKMQEYIRRLQKSY